MRRDGEGPTDATFRTDLADDVCRFRRVNRRTRFLSTGFDGGTRVADAAYNVTVPEGWGDVGHRDLGAYVDERVESAGFVDDGATPPALLTGVKQRHARIARLDGAAVLATAGVSNPAALPVPDPRDGGDQAPTDDDPPAAGGSPPVGTVNLLVGANRVLTPGALANLVAVAAEAKAATLLATVGVPGTTSDAVIVGCPSETGTEAGRPAEFSGSATTVGSAVRACVRDAVHAALVSRYGRDFETAPESVADADHGIVTDRFADVSTPDR